LSGHEMRGLLRPFLLLLLLERASHGYDLIERLADMGVPDVDPSHAYRVLRNLERNRLVASTWVAGGGPARRRYELTPAGCADLSDWAERLIQLDRVLGDCVARFAQATGAGSMSAAGRR
jgi:PadR family transcriptional regulator, regulatory protein PadR